MISFECCMSSFEGWRSHLIILNRTEENDIFWKLYEFFRGLRESFDNPKYNGGKWYLLKLLWVHSRDKGILW